MSPSPEPRAPSPDLLDGVELQTVDRPSAAVIWLHGLGADGYDFVPVVRELQQFGAPAARYVFPHAPMQPVTINGGYVMRAWYDILGTDLTRREDEPGIRTSQSAVERLIEREAARSVPPSRVVLAGFSQGGAIALHTGLRQPAPVAGLMAHGTSDPVVPLARGLASRDRLLALGHDVHWQDYPMPHSVCAEEIEAIAGFLRRVIPS